MGQDKSARDWYGDVREFQTKFKTPMANLPCVCDAQLAQFKIDRLQEELDEIIQAVNDQDAVQVADGIVDLIYIALGLAANCGLPINQVWDEVHAANMRKQPVTRAEDSRFKSEYDVIKPDGWMPPDVAEVIVRWMVQVASDRNTPKADVEKSLAFLPGFAVLAYAPNPEWMARDMVVVNRQQDGRTVAVLQRTDASLVIVNDTDSKKEVPSEAE